MFPTDVSPERNVSDPSRVPSLGQSVPLTTCPMSMTADYRRLLQTSVLSYTTVRHLAVQLPVCRPAHGHTGVFQNNFLLHKLLALIFAINPFLLFFSGTALSRTFSAISYRRKNACFFCRTIIWETFFSRSFHCCIFTFLNEPCQLFISKEWNHPVTLSCRSPWFYEGKGDGGRLTTTVYNSPTRSTNFQIQII